MELHDYVRVLRKRWATVVVATLIGVIAAGAFVATRTKEYTASTRLFVSTQNTADASITAAVQGSTFSQDRVKSYADIVNTPPVMQEVIDTLHLPTTPQALGGKVSASAPLDTVLLNISVTDDIPAQAALIANATATAFVDVVTALEKPADGSPSPIRVTIVEQAHIPSAPSSPNKTLDLGLGLLVGLAIGIGLAVLRDTLDTSVKRPDDMADLTGAATLAIIGFDSEVATKPLIIDASPHAPRAEALRQLRTNLQFADVDNPPKSVVLTSSVPKEGKSSTAVNLALTLARGGKRVILVEGDLRRPRVARYLGFGSELPGITDVLVGKYSLDEALTPFRDERVQVLSAGPTPPNPSELLGSAAMHDLMADLESRCDIVIIDAPPILPVTDAAVLSDVCDGVIFVVRAGKTKREQVSRAVANLHSVDARVLGCVLNMASAKGPEAYAYGYGYDYAPEGRKARKARKAEEAARKVAAKEQAKQAAAQAKLSAQQAEEAAKVAKAQAKLQAKADKKAGRKGGAEEAPVQFVPAPVQVTPTRPVAPVVTEAPTAVLPAAVVPAPTVATEDVEKVWRQFDSRVPVQAAAEVEESLPPVMEPAAEAKQASALERLRAASRGEG